MAADRSPLQARIEAQIHSLRGQRVMIDADLALLYATETRALVQAVKRNRARFPADFMFQLDAAEWAVLRSQLVISNGRGGRRLAPYAFTEQGVAMLSSVLGSSRAVAVNIAIMRTFVKVRAMAFTHEDLAKRLGELEKKADSLAFRQDALSRNTRAQLKQVFDALRDLMAPPEQPHPPMPPKRPIGFVTPEERKPKAASVAKKQARRPRRA